MTCHREYGFQLAQSRGLHYSKLFNGTSIIIRLDGPMIRPHLKASAEDASGPI